jgi:hypothetical protein
MLSGGDAKKEGVLWRLGRRCQSIVIETLRRRSQRGSFESLEHFSVKEAVESESYTIRDIFALAT